MSSPQEPARLDLPSEDQVIGSETRRLVRFLRVNIAGLAVTVLSMVAIVAVIGSARMWVIIAILAVLLAAVAVAERLVVRHGSPVLGLHVFALAVWAYAISTTILAPFLLPVNLLVLLVPLIFPIVLLNRRQAARLLIGAGLVAYAVVALAELLPGTMGRPPAWAERTIIIGVTSAVVTVNVYGMGILFDRASEYSGLLRASRARMAAVAMEARRRIERDLHDGAQQRLVSTSVRLTLAARQLETDPGRAAETLHEASAELRHALEDLRELAHGIYPPLLVQRGLASALAAATRQAPFPVELDASDDRLETDLEATIYFCCLEAVQNAAKHARPDRVRIALRFGDPVEFLVHDDGVGFDPAVVQERSGLVNMSDRVAALDGGLDIASAPGAGTTVHGWVPRPAGGPEPA